MLFGGEDRATSALECSNERPALLGCGGDRAIGVVATMGRKRGGSQPDEHLLPIGRQAVLVVDRDDVPAGDQHVMRAVIAMTEDDVPCGHLVQQVFGGARDPINPGGFVV